jgi:bifunctional non-homologous end joining protein LigD
MLVSPAAELPAGEEWAFEVKWDGMRALVAVDPAVRVRGRHGPQDWLDNSQPLD